MDKEKKSLRKQLAKYKDAIPSRAKLGMESMFAPTQEERDAAQHLLDILPKEQLTRDEEIAAITEAWLTTNALVMSTLSDMEKSPVGRATLEMMRTSKPIGDDIAKRDSISAPEPPADAEAPQDKPAAPEPVAETPNEFASQLSGWPPKGSPAQPPPEPADPPIWIRHLNRPQVTPWVDDANNSPIY